MPSLGSRGAPASGVLGLLLFLAACAGGPQRRIRANQSAFDAYPPEAQQAIREGRVNVGFSAEQALMALGRPDRKFVRKTAEIEQEVWSYTDGRSGRTGLGVGIGVSGGGPTIYGGGVSIGGGIDPYAADEHTRLVFESGRVVSVEARKDQPR